jgi:hypothetical protein
MNANNFLLGVSSVKKNNSKKELNKNKNRLNTEKITVEEINNSNKQNGNILFSNKINSLNIEKNNSLLVQQNLNKTNEVFPKYSLELINHIKKIENDIKMFGNKNLNDADRLFELTKSDLLKRKIGNFILFRLNSDRAKAKFRQWNNSD